MLTLSDWDEQYCAGYRDKRRNWAMIVQFAIVSGFVLLAAAMRPCE